VRFKKNETIQAQKSQKKNNKTQKQKYTPPKKNFKSTMRIKIYTLRLKKKRWD
jgi:hypothetical protein